MEFKDLVQDVIQGVLDVYSTTVRRTAQRELQVQTRGGVIKLFIQTQTYSDVVTVRTGTCSLMRISPKAHCQYSAAPQALDFVSIAPDSLVQLWPCCDDLSYEEYRLFETDFSTTPQAVQFNLSLMDYPSEYIDTISALYSVFYSPEYMQYRGLGINVYPQSFIKLFKLSTNGL